MAGTAADQSFLDDVTVTNLKKRVIDISFLTARERGLTINNQHIRMYVHADPFHFSRSPFTVLFNDSLIKVK